MQLHTINTGLFKLDGGAMFGVVPKTIWNKLQPADENNLCTWAMRCLLIQEGNKLILVDNGIGDKQDAKFLSHYHLHGDDTLDKSLAALGLHRDDITDVLLTHLHFDHCGGSIIRQGDRLVPAFKNATYWTHSTHWQWAVEPNDREKASFLKENILPIQESGQLRFVDTATVAVAGAALPGARSGLAGAGLRGADATPAGAESAPAGSTPEGAGITPLNHATAASLASGALPHTSGSLDTIADVIIPGLSVRIANGHTASMILPQLHYKGHTFVYMADLLPSVSHFPLPYVMGYDMFPLTTLQEKKSFFEEAAAGNYVLFFEHDPINECCTPEQTEKGIRAGKTFRLKDL